MAALGQAAAEDAVCSLLAVHGKRQCGELFQRRLETTVRRLRRLPARVEVTWLDAPFTLPLEPGQEVPMRSWYECADEEGGEDGDDALADMTPAVSVLSDAITHSRTHGVGVNGIIAFSQGCAVVAEAARRGLLKDVQFLVFAGGLLPRGWDNPPSSLTIPSLHFAGTKDEVVLPTTSELLASAFDESVFHLHEQGHCVPSRAVDSDVLVSFAQKNFRPLSQSPAGSGLQTKADGGAAAEEEEEEEEEEDVGDAGAGEFTASEELTDELTCLESMYPEEFAVQDGGRTCTVALSEDTHAATLAFQFSSTYPSVALNVKVQESNLSSVQQKELLAMIQAEALEIEGEPGIFAVVSTAQEYLQTTSDKEAEAAASAATATATANAQLAEEPESEPEDAEGEDDGSIEPDVLRALTLEAAVTNLALQQGDHTLLQYRRRGGKNSSRMSWGNFTVGLVGKPSAGKSTFFNACKTRQSIAARIGAYPFTTIEPNIGRGCYRCEYPSVIRVEAGASRVHEVEIVLKVEFVPYISCF